MAAVLAAANRHKSAGSAPLERRTGFEQHQRTTRTEKMRFLPPHNKCGLPIPISDGEIRLASEQQRKHSMVATFGSTMTSRLASFVTVIHTRIGSQEHVHNRFPPAFGSDDERRWLKPKRQARVDIN